MAAVQFSVSHAGSCHDIGRVRSPDDYQGDCLLADRAFSRSHRHLVECDKDYLSGG